MKKIKTITLWVLLIICSLCLMGILSLEPEPYASQYDSVISKISMGMMFIPAEIGLLLELNLFKIKSKIPLLKSDKIKDHILFWCIVIFASLFLVAITYSMLSDEYKSNRSQQTIEETETLNILNETSPTTETPTTVNPPQTPSLPQETTVIQNISNQNEIISDESPLVFTYDNADYDVGNCSFSIERIEVATQPHKGQDNSMNIFRIYGSVKNNSSESTIFSTAKYNSYIIGSQFENEKEEYIGFNSNLRWGCDNSNGKFSKDYSLSPGEETNFSVQAVYIGTPKTYAYTLDDVVFYFCNNDNLLTISFD